MKSDDIESKVERSERTPFPTETFGGVLLILATIFALLWANSRWESSYFQILEQSIVMPGEFFQARSLREWINDGLMTIFFLVVALEIKREAIMGSLATPARAGLPVLAALGGILVPALTYICFTAYGADPRGWGVPVATDVAFALAILKLFGRYVQTGLKAFLTTLAIADDIGAIIVIGAFYASSISLLATALAVLITGLLAVCNRLNIRQLSVYVILGFFLWVVMLQSGIQPTLAGVLLSLVVPLLNRDKLPQDGNHSPLQRLENALLPISAWVIIPLFAFANAGVKLPLTSSISFLAPSSLAIFAALLIGKPIGIFLFSWLAVKLKIGSLPLGVSWEQIAAASCLGGIGFTVSLFIASQAFNMPLSLDQAKVGILAGSLGAAILGSAVLALVIVRESKFSAGGNTSASG